MTVRAQGDSGRSDRDNRHNAGTAGGIAPTLPTARARMNAVDCVGFNRQTKSGIMQDAAEPALEVVVALFGGHEVTSSVGARCGAASDSSK
jgi:hypothetical protein